MTNKQKKSNRSTDRFFKELFMGLTTLAVMLVFILSMHLFLGVPLYSRTLWGGSVAAYLATNLIIDVSGIIKKIVVLSVSSVIMGIFFTAVLNWALVPSLLIGMVIIILSALLYMTFLQ